MKEKNTIMKWLDKLFGGINMSWPAVILFAVLTAVLTSVFLIFPVFQDTSFQRMGVTLEAWILFAVIIMANCKTPVESSCKTFVFFLISQPLIYLFQVPFSWQGWGIFRYYGYWFIWTLLTIPMAYVGWYINKRNWLSLLIFAPVIAFLGYTAAECGLYAFRNFPHLIVTMLFCILQIAMYIIEFFPDIKQKLIAVIIPVIVIVLVTLITPQVDMQVTEPLPNNPSFSDGATVEVADRDILNADLHSNEEGIIYIHAHKYGSTIITIIDGNTVTKYNVDVYSDNGITNIRITLINN